MPPARPLRFPERQTEELRLPMVGAGESRIRDLMPHRPRLRPLREGEDITDNRGNRGNGDSPSDRP